MRGIKAGCLVCPNCFGTTYREVLVTPTSRNINPDTPATPSGSGWRSGKRQEIVKRLCLRCGHEVNRNGGRV